MYTQPDAVRTQGLDRNGLLEQFLPLVGQVLASLRRRLPSHVDIDDLHSAGVLGLLAAVGRFDAAQSASFVGYAKVRIRGAILDELRRSDTCSRRSRAMMKRIETAENEITQEHQRPATEEEICTRLSLQPRELRRFRECGAPIRIISLDGNNDARDSDRALHEQIADADQPCVWSALEQGEMLEALARCLERLPVIEKQLLTFYYFEGLRFAEIAAVFELTESRISQIHTKALARLRQLFRQAQHDNSTTEP
jgi:RNA polymerase sigma factor for flagellar operon FliA